MIHAGYHRSKYTFMGLKQLNSGLFPLSYECDSLRPSFQQSDRPACKTPAGTITACHRRRKLSHDMTVFLNEAMRSKYGSQLLSRTTGPDLPP